MLNSRSRIGVESNRPITAPVPAQLSDDPSPVAANASAKIMASQTGAVPVANWALTNPFNSKRKNS